MSETGTCRETASAVVPPARLAGEVRAAVRQVREALLAAEPRTVASCGGDLAEAAEKLRRLRAVAISADARAARDLRQLASPIHRDLQQLRGLLEQAGAFYLGWSKILAAAGTYGADGALRSPPADGWSVEG